MVENGFDPNDKSSTQRFPHFDISTTNQYLIGITNLTPLGRFFDTSIFDVDHCFRYFLLYVGPT